MQADAPRPDAQTAPATAADPVVVKKYANRRLYNTESSSYITLDDLAGMVRAGRDFVVFDAKSGEDITRGVLTQIIVEEESKGGAMLPTAFLRQLIGFYGGTLEGVVPRYLEQAMAAFNHQQVQMRSAVQKTMGSLMPFGMEEIGRQNLAMIERAMSLFTPFYRAPGAADAGPEAPIPEASAPVSTTPAAPPPAPDENRAEVERLRREVESLRHQLAAAHADAAVPRAETAVVALPPPADPIPPAAIAPVAGSRRGGRPKPPPAPVTN